MDKIISCEFLPIFIFVAFTFTLFRELHKYIKTSIGGLMAVSPLRGCDWSCDHYRVTIIIAHLCGQVFKCPKALKVFYIYITQTLSELNIFFYHYQFFLFLKNLFSLQDTQDKWWILTNLRPVFYFLHNRLGNELFIMLAAS